MPVRIGSMRRIQAFALAASLALSSATAAPSIAEDVSPETVPAETVPAEGLLKEKAAAAEKVMDETHAFLERTILERVIRFDEFFGSVKAEDTRPPGYLIRWRNALRWDEGGRFKYRTSVRANVRLPKVGERARLIVSGENEAEPSPSLPDDPGNPGFDRTLQNTRLVNAEIRYEALQTPSATLFLGAGVRLVLPLEPFVRSRFQYIHRLGADSLARFGETLFWKDRDGVGETTEIGLERKLDSKTLLRWANSGTISRISKGLEWGTELSLLREFSPRSAITFGGGVFGDTRPSTKVENSRIFTRYRRNFLRSWLFFELEPEISWPRTPAGGFDTAYALTSRVDVVFQGSAAGKGR